MGELNLRELNLSQNKLGDETVPNCNSWEFLDGCQLRKQLNLLDLSNNEMKRFPSHLLNLQNLITLKLDRNEINRIPLAIGKISKLRYVYYTIIIKININE